MVRFRLEKIEVISVEILPKGIPWNWKYLRMLAVPIDRRRKAKYCTIVIDPIRYEKDQKFKKKVLAKMRREIQKSYNS